MMRPLDTDGSNIRIHDPVLLSMNSSAHIYLSFGNTTMVHRGAIASSTHPLDDRMPYEIKYDVRT